MQPLLSGWHRFGLFCLAYFTVIFAAESGPAFVPQKYSLQLSLNEFSILNAAEVDGLLKYGGSGDFKVTMAKVGNEVVWTVVVESPRQMELLGIFVGEKTIKIVQGLEPNTMDASEKLALETIKSLTQKMEVAQKNPLWDSLKLTGTVVPQGTNWVLQTTDDAYRLKGNKISELSQRSGQPVIVTGYLKQPGELEVNSFIEKPANTLELFVMSHCPFAQQAEAKLLAFLAQTNLTAPPQLQLHYLFFKTQKDGKDVFGSPHGAEEVTENLVQMVIRDVFPNRFQPYLRERITHPGATWKSLAEKVGLDASNLTLINQMITDQRESLLRGEYDTMLDRYGVVDASPSFFWEGEPVRDLGKLAVFKGLDQLKLETCTN